MTKTYSELILIPTFEERLEYLHLSAAVGDPTFGWNRYLNQALYTSPEWRRFRRDIILRDKGCDLALEGYELDSKNIIIHHINPITVEQVLNRDPALFDRNNVVCTCGQTHRMIHYGLRQKEPDLPSVRSPYDTCPWRKTKGGYA